MRVWFHRPGPHRRPSGRNLVCREGWYYLLVLTFVSCSALLREINLLLVIAGLMVGPLIYSRASLVSRLRGLRVRRRAPDAVQAGDELLVEIELDHRAGRRDARLVIVDDRLECAVPQRDTPQHCVQILASRVESGGRIRHSYHLRLNDRGRYRFAPLTVQSRYPLGLLRRRVTYASTQTLTVYPRTGRLLPAWNRRRGAVSGSRRRFGQATMSDGDFVGLRDWQVGDSRRLIHWRTTARRGAPVVRLLQPPHEADLVLLLDLWHPAGEHDQEAATETAVSLSATALADACRRGNCRVVLAVAGQGETKPLGGLASRSLLAEMMERLAVVQAGTVDDLGDQASQAMAGRSHTTAVVVVSTRTRADARNSAHNDWLLQSDPLWIDVASSQLSEYYQPL